MINPNEWLKTRKNLLEQVKSQVSLRTGALPKAISRYSAALDSEFSRGWNLSTLKELREALQRARVVLAADFHAYGQSQRAHVRVLRDHLGHQDVTLALECLSHDKEAQAQDFLSGKISEARFLEEVNWRKNWGFPWEHYRPVFELARDRGFNLVGLGNFKIENLEARDRWTAKKILKVAKANPSSLIYAIIGELHLASSHLPARIRSGLKNEGQIATVFQDAEKLYFQLAKKAQESGVEVMRASGDRFCLMVSPPWMKWQSYLMYLEQTYDRDLQEDIAIDYSDHVASLIELLEGDLKIEVSKSKVQVYSPASKASLGKLRMSLPKRYAKALVYHLEHDLSFFVPEKDWLYLSRSTINHASALAGQFVHAHLAGRKRTLWDLPEDFLPLIWVEALAFFFSKWINPKRKSETLESVRLQLTGRSPKDRGRAALLLALDHRLSEVVWVQTGRLRRARFKPKEKLAYLEASRILGSMLGERLFQKVRSRTISLAQLMSYLKVDVEDKRFADFYWNLIRKTEHDQSI